MAHTCLIVKTHGWNHNLELRLRKIFQEAHEVGVDAYLLMHTDTGELINSIENQDLLKAKCLTFTTQDIQNLYPKGFFSMRLSNHWILMWFFQKYGNYQYYWSMEYDVAIAGDSGKIWSHTKSDHDFLYVLGNFTAARLPPNQFYTGPGLALHEKRYGFLQLARYSKRALEYLDKVFQSGENAQDEIIVYTLMHRSGYSMSNQFLAKLRRGDWTWRATAHARNYALYQKAMQHFAKNVYIFHPVKP